MQPSRSVSPVRGIVPSGQDAPFFSILTQAAARPEAVVTIGRWRIIFIPEAPVQNAVSSSQHLHGFSETEWQPPQQPADLRQVERSPGEGDLLPAGTPTAAAGDAIGIPDGVVWIDVDKPSDQAVVAQELRDRPERIPDLSTSATAQGSSPGQQQHQRTVAGKRQPGVTDSKAASSIRAFEPVSGRSMSYSAVSWALLSQVFWIPLVAMDLHDRWVAHQRDITPPGQALPVSPIARATSTGLNELLGAARPLQQLAGQANQAISGSLGQAVRGAHSGVGTLLSSAASTTSSLLDAPLLRSLETASPVRASEPALNGPALSTAPPEPTLLGRAFTRSQLLGGSISLSDLQEGPLAPLALVERALQRSSGDPLSPLPSQWREPMRQALLRLPGAPQQLKPARQVFVPSLTVSRSVEVPLALQSDGSIDVLEAPSDPAVLREIEGWSRQQRPPVAGSLQPALVHLHPLQQPATLSPDAAPGAAAAGRAATGNGNARVTTAARPESRPIPSQAVKLPPQSDVSEPAASAPSTQAPIISESSEPARTTLSEVPAAVAPSAGGAAMPVPPAP